jgi:hypothetical protein
MKIRNGFVSNSSSASFIIHWRVKDFGADYSTKRALATLYDISYSAEQDEYNFERWDTEYKPRLECMEKQTQKNANGTFTSTFFTSMLNNCDDFGTDASSLLLAIAVSDRAELIDTKVDDW